MMITEEYLPGRELDVHGEGHAGIVLLWHGRAGNSRRDVAGLAAAVASRGLRVVVPDWDCEDEDGGRSTLVGSLVYAHRLAVRMGRYPSDTVVAGWSLGGTAAVGLAISERETLPIARVVLLS